MNETFSPARFGKTFKYIFAATARRSGLGAVAAPAAVLIITALSAQLLKFLVGNMDLEMPAAARAVIIAATHFIVMLFMASRSFGFLTDRRDNITWLMFPASTLEKYLSVIIIYYFITPLAVLAAGYAADSLIALTGLGGFKSFITFSGIASFFDKVSEITNLGQLKYLMGNAVAGVILQYFALCGFVLLCALYFRSHKVLKTVGIYIGAQILVSWASTPLLFTWANQVSDNFDMYYTEEFVLSGINTLAWTSLVITALLAIGFNIAIYFRMRTMRS